MNSKLFDSKLINSGFFQSFLDELPLPVIKFNQKFDIVYQNKTATQCFSSFKDKSTNKITSFSLAKISLAAFVRTKKNFEQIQNCCDFLINKFLEQPAAPVPPISIFLSCKHNPDPTYNVQWQISILPQISHKVYEFVATIMCNSEFASLKVNLDAKEAELQSIFRASPLGIGIAENRKITSVNPYFCNMLGYDKQELLGKNAQIVYSSKEEYARVGRVKHPQILEKGVGSIETQFKSKDGQLLDVFLSSAAKKNNDLSTGVIFTALDISQLKKMQRALHESQHMLKTVINAVPARIFWKDINSTFLGCNQAFADDLGIPNLDTIIGKTVFDFFSRDSAEEYTQTDKKILETGKGYLNYLEHQVDKDGLYRWFRESKVPLFDIEGEIIGLMGIYEDITKIHDSEQKMAQIQDQLIHVQKLESIGRLAGGIAHEFNNLLTAILGYSELLELEGTESDGFVAEASRVITENAKKGALITQQLLGFARTGKFNPMPYDINRLIVNVFQMTGPFFSKSIITNLRLSTTPIIVELDKTQFELALTNLLLNARDAMPKGGVITIVSSIVDKKSEDWETLIQQLHRTKILSHYNQYARIVVSDTGEGMTETVKQHLFEPFFSTKETNKGTGLGLSTVFGIITNHEGAITLQSTLREGTSFILYLPISSEQETHISDPHLLKVQHGRGTILIVDDESDIRKSLDFRLKKLGYNVLSAVNGEEALEQFKKSHASIDVILLDMVMPKMDGPECFLKLKEIDPGAKIILISGFTQKNVIKEMIASGAYGFLQKPFNFAHLSSILHSCFKKNDSNG